MKILAIVLISVLLILGSERFAVADNAIAKAPASVASVATGTAVGTPIAIVRKTKSQFIGCLKEYKKDSNAYKAMGAACSAIVAVPAGAVKGTLCGAKNAVVHSVDKPFSKESFSLGDLEGAAKPIKPRPPGERPESQPWGTPR